MTPAPPPHEHSLAAKISRLVQERGWNQEDFARIANLNRHTVRQILQQGENRRLRNATVMACARALGLTVSELRSLPLERLLPRMHGAGPEEGEDKLKRLYELAKQPELRAWIDRHPERVKRLTPTETEELLALQGDDGPLAKVGVEHFVELFERKRKLHEMVDAVASTEYLPFLEQFVALLVEKVEPR
jgi:transcriptional regulator with XRE-family HTH domain